MFSGACLSAMSWLHHQRLQTRRNEQERAGWKAANGDGSAAEALGQALRAPGLKKLAGLGALSGLSTGRVLSAFPPAPPPLSLPRPHCVRPAPRGHLLPSARRWRWRARECAPGC